jgi:hypothetical protein
MPEAAFLPSKLLTYFLFTLLTFVIPIYFGSGSKSGIRNAFRGSYSDRIRLRFGSTTQIPGIPVATSLNHGHDEILSGHERQLLLDIARYHFWVHHKT